MNKSIQERLGRHSEIELVELAAVDEAGGKKSSKLCVKISKAVCPTTACSRVC